MLPSPSPICVSSELLLADSTARVMDLAILKLKQNLSNIITDRESKNILILAESDSWFVYRSIVPKNTTELSNMQSKWDERNSNLGIRDWSFWMKKETLLDIGLIILIGSEYYQSDWCVQNKISFQQIPAPTCPMSKWGFRTATKGLGKKYNLIRRLKEKKDILLEINTSAVWPRANEWVIITCIGVQMSF